MIQHIDTFFQEDKNERIKKRRLQKWPSPLCLNQSYLYRCRWKWKVRLSSVKNQVYFLKTYIKSINKMLIEGEKNETG